MSMEIAGLPGKARLDDERWMCLVCHGKYDNEVEDCPVCASSWREPRPDEIPILNDADDIPPWCLV